MRDSLAGLSVPSVEELVRDAVAKLGIATIDLADRKQRERLETLLEYNIGNALRWHLGKAIEQACEKAVKHVLALMDDPDYQQRRHIAAQERAKERAERRAEKAEKSRAERELSRQQQRRLVQ